MAEAIQLFESKDRDETHKFLERVLAEGKYPRAECRQDDGNGIYTVWSGQAGDS